MKKEDFLHEEFYEPAVKILDNFTDEILSELFTYLEEVFDINNRDVYYNEDKIDFEYSLGCLLKGKDFEKDYINLYRNLSIYDSEVLNVYIVKKLKEHLISN